MYHHSCSTPEKCLLGFKIIVKLCFIIPGYNVYMPSNVDLLEAQ